MKLYRIVIGLENKSAVCVKTTQPFLCLEEVEQWIVGKVRQLHGKGRISLVESGYGHYGIFVGNKHVAAAGVTQLATSTDKDCSGKGS